jgi:hypothetical protein
MKIKITRQVQASCNESGNASKIYAVDEIIDCKHQWQKDLAEILIAESSAIEDKVAEPKETKKKVVKKKTTKKSK